MKKVSWHDVDKIPEYKLALADALYRQSADIVRELDAAAGPRLKSFARLQVMVVLLRHGRVKMGAIADDLKTSKPNATSLLRGLETDGWVRFRKDQNDGRSVIVEIIPRRIKEARQLIEAAANTAFENSLRLGQQAPKLNQQVKDATLLVYHRLPNADWPTSFDILYETSPPNTSKAGRARKQARSGIAAEDRVIEPNSSCARAKKSISKTPIA
jgi:DNA-binding MarR family transcriptional regulator